MALYKRIKSDEGIVIGVWKIEETLETLLSLYTEDKELQLLSESNLNKQKLIEKIAVRVLLHTLLPNEDVVITYEPSGKPILNSGDYNLSISHTKGFVAVILGLNQYQVGIDIEPISERTVKVAKRFMGVEEYAELMKHQDKTVSTICWSAKETLYKIVGHSVVDFSESMLVHPFKVNSEGSILIEQNNNRHEIYKFDYTIFDDTVLVWGIKKNTL